MNRINKKFSELKRKKKKAFIAYITAGYPSLKVTEALIPALEKAGADLIELGVPFSDPMADGLTIQESSQAALEKGVNLTQIFDLVKRIRRHSQVPIAFMTYYNPVFHYGEARFAAKAREAGVDGVIIPDLPPEEGASLIKHAKKANLATVFFLSPTTAPARVKKIAQASTGFIYYVSLTGITGTQAALPTDVIKNIKAAKRRTNKPICAGFGITTPGQVKSIAKVADGVIVGSAIVKVIKANIGRSSLVQKTADFVHSLTKVL